MTEQEELYGAAAPHSDYQCGDRVRYLDPECGEADGEIIHVSQVAGQVLYTVLPDETQFPLQIAASDIIERV